MGRFLGVIFALMFTLNMAFILSLSFSVKANATENIIVDTSPDDLIDTENHLTGSQGERTYINEPGSSEDPEDLKELNIANTVTITYDNGNGSLNGALRILIILTLISLAPTLLVMMTSFTRIIVALHFTRTAIGTQTSPPNLVMIGIALFMTLFIMQPTFHTVYNEAVIPFENGEMTQQEFFEKRYGSFQTVHVRTDSEEGRNPFHEDR